MLEREPYILKDLFIGDRNLFNIAFSNPETIIFYDLDGILADTPKVVLEKFFQKNNVCTLPFEINSWSHLTQVATNAGLDMDKIQHAEDDWYKADVLSLAQSYLYVRPVVEKTIKLFTPNRNFVLTSREPHLTDSTISWISSKYPQILTENILIREDDTVKPTEFKVNEIKLKAKKAPWVILIDDSTKYIKSALEAKIENLIAINIPLGKIMPDFTHPQMILIKRYPAQLQAMYPLMHAINLAT